MRQLVLWGMTLWLFGEAIANIAQIGKTRAPKTPYDGVLAIISIAAWVAALHYLANS